MQTSINRAIRVGRAMMLALGLAVTLSLVLGAVSVALAAVPGDPFKLGRINLINNATTSLQGGGPSVGAGPLFEVKRTGTGIGPALTVENASTGNLGKQGILVKVDPGRSPVSVSQDAGTASQLSADELDGRDQEEFLSASRVYGVSQLKTNNSGDREVFFSLGCDQGDIAINGGGNATDPNDAVNSLFPFAGSLQVEFTDNEPEGSSFRGILICSDSSKPFRDQ